jgi:hypothetical protein
MGTQNAAGLTVVGAPDRSIRRFFRRTWVGEAGTTISSRHLPCRRDCWTAPPRNEPCDTGVQVVGRVPHMPTRRAPASESTGRLDSHAPGTTERQKARLTQRPR